MLYHRLFVGHFNTNDGVKERSVMNHCFNISSWLSSSDFLMVAQITVMLMMITVMLMMIIVILMIGLNTGE